MYGSVGYKTFTSLCNHLLIAGMPAFICTEGTGLCIFCEQKKPDHPNLHELRQVLKLLQRGTMDEVRLMYWNSNVIKPTELRLKWEHGDPSKDD